jgi:hypothetical protein
MEIPKGNPAMAVLFPASSTRSETKRACVAYAKVPDEDLIVLCNLEETNTEGWFEIGWALQRPTEEHDIEYYLNQACNQLANQKESSEGQFLSLETINLIFANAPIEALKNTFAGFLQLEAGL